jgi:histidine ammonia-lyase
MTGAIKLRKIVELAEMVVALELITAAQGLEYRLPLQPGAGARQAREIVRRHVAPLTRDRAMSADVESVAALVRAGEFDELI